MMNEMHYSYGTHWGQEWCVRALVERYEGKKPLGTSGHKFKDNIKMYFKCDWEAWTGLIWLRMGTGCGGL
jgi:hypothetical protein